MRERKSNFAVVGSAGSLEKGIVFDRINGLLYKDHLTSLDNEERKDLRQNETPKTEEDLCFIELANERTNQLLESVQFEPYNIPAQNFHRVGRNFLKKYGHEKAAGAFDEEHQMILLSNTNSFPNNDRLYRALTIFHEALHLKSYLAHQVTVEHKNDDQINLFTKRYREGVDVFSSQRKKTTEKDAGYFMGLNEAIVSHEEKEYLQDLLQNPIFAEEIKKITSPKAQQIKKVLEEEQGVASDEIITFDFSKNYYLKIGYQEQRNVLDYLCQQIAQDIECSPERIYKEFLRSQLTGQLILLAKLVENSFGKGSFRGLGRMTEEKETAVATLESMRSLIQRRKVS